MTDYLLNEINTPLLAWYDKGHRDLPWRRDRDAYRIWVSEIMLQQTRVEAVKPYYFRFMERFFDVSELAGAKEELLLKYWEGLGYYSRIRNMKKAAQIIVNQYNGILPDNWDELQKLPGIGSYTAGAIASIAYGQPVPAVDGNVLRIISRLRMDDALISDASVKKRVERELLESMSQIRPGDFNQAMMELGATVCLPGGTPKCGECPWQELCLAHISHCEMEFPKKAPKKKRVIEEKTVLVLKRGEMIAIHKRPESGLLAGMYELPMLNGRMKEKELLKRLKDIGILAIRIKYLGDAKHIFTHKEWHMSGYAVLLDEWEDSRNKKAEGIEDTEMSQGDYIFINRIERKERYPIPSAFSAYAKYLDIKLGNKRFTEDV